jgi:hypothetical protein
LKTPLEEEPENMTKESGKIRYSSSNCIQDIFGFICNYFLSYYDPGQEYVDEIHNDQFQAKEPQRIQPIPIALVHTPIPIDIPVRHKPCALSPIIVEIPVSCKPLALPPIPAKIPDKYKPLVLPSILNDLPANYSNNLPMFDGENAKITAEKHIQNLEDFLDLFEVEEDDVCIRMFSLSLQGKVKEWFKNIPAASIRNFHQFMQVFLGQWVIMGNLFLILEEYDHLKRQLKETVQHFSARFNKVYHSIPADIRPPLGLTHLCFPDAFDPKMAFQLRERNTSTLEEMKNIAVDVEANLLNRKEKLKALMKDRTKKEHLVSLGIKLDILTNIVNEVMHNIRRREETVVLKPYVSLVPERENINVPKIFPIHPQYSDPPNDYFMYSIYDTSKDEVKNQMVMEKPPKMMCMFDDLGYVDDFPGYDHHGDDYVVELDVNCSEKPTPSSWEE